MPVAKSYTSLKQVCEPYELNGKMYRYDMGDNQYIYFFVMNDAVKYFGYAEDVQN